MQPRSGTSRRPCGLAQRRCAGRLASVVRHNCGAYRRGYGTRAIKIKRENAMIPRALLAVFLILSATDAMAQAFPNKPVRLILWGAGSFPDIVARRIKEHLAVRWGQTVIVENRAGAGGILAAATGVQAPPDGHTLVWGDPVGWAFNQPAEGGSNP